MHNKIHIYAISYIWISLCLPGCNGSACDGIGGTCIDLTVTGGLIVDQLQIALSLPGAPLDHKLVPSDGTESTSLPVHVALHVSESGAGGTGLISVVGYNAGATIGSGSTGFTVSPGAGVRATVDIGNGVGGAGPTQTPFWLE
jgi:hypothetical protein